MSSDVAGVTAAESYADRYAGSAAGTASRPLAATDTTTTNARTPSAHAASHASAGSDAVTPAAIGAAPATGIAESAVTNLTTDLAAKLPIASTVPNANATATPIFTITPPTRAPFQFSEWSGGPQGDGTYDHWFGFGFNANVHPVNGGASGAPATANQPALYMGLEDGFDSSGVEAMEWYVAYWSPDRTSVPLFRPFYTKVATTAQATTVAAGSNTVGTSTFAGAGVLNVASTTGFPASGDITVATGGTPAVISYTNITATTFTGCTTASGGGVLATGGSVGGYACNAATFLGIGNDGAGVFQISSIGYNPLFVVQGTGVYANNIPANLNVTLIGHTSATIYFQVYGANQFQLMYSAFSGLFSLYDSVHSRYQVTFLPGASNTAALAEFQSSVKVDGNVGFFGTTPVVAQVSGGTTAGVIAGLVALGLFSS